MHFMKAKKRNKRLPILSDCVGADISSITSIHAQDPTIRGANPKINGGIRSTSCELLSSDNLKPVTLIVEMTCEIGMGGSCPLVESMEFYKALLVKFHTDLLIYSSCPCLQISIAGPYLQLSLFGVTAANGSMVENIPCAEPITDLICCNGKHVNQSFTLKLANLFQAVRECLGELDKYYTSIAIDKSRHFTSCFIDRKIFEKELSYISTNPLAKMKYLKQQVATTRKFSNLWIE